MQAFATPVALRAPARAPATSALSSRRPTYMSAITEAAANAYMARTVRAAYKRAAALPGTYSVQCAEGAVHGEAYETAVRARNAAFRARQATVSAQYKDLYATRRAAVVLAHGCSGEEAKLVRFAGAAAAFVGGKAEEGRACSRYVARGEAGVVGGYMRRAVEAQYKAMSAEGGVYGMGCMDGGVAGEAEVARVTAGSVLFKAGQFPAGAKAQARYNSSAQATALSRGCDYEEKQFSEYPAMASAMRWGAGVYAAVKAGAAAGISGGIGKKAAPLAVRLAGVNGAALWPSSLRRPAIKRVTAPWEESTLKQYRGMSPAALAYGIKAQTGAYKGGDATGKWASGWQPVAKNAKSYASN